MYTVLVLSGGTSEEREVSLRSGSAVTDALQSTGNKILSYDPSEGLDQLKTLTDEVDVVFPVLHGAGGEDGSIQEYLTRLDIPFVGSGSETSRLCFDKYRYTQFLKNHGFICPDNALVAESELWHHPLTKKPFVLKPHTGGSSIDMCIVRDLSEIPRAKIADIYTRHEKMLLEELIEGVEVTVPILGEAALSVIEIVPPQNEEFDYENKYNGKTKEWCPPATIDRSTQKQLQELALQIHQITGCSDMSRTDIIIRNDGSLVVLETNTIPGLTSQSLMPKSAAVSGISMPQLATKLIDLALSRQY